MLTSGDSYLPHFGERVYEVVELDKSKMEMRASILTVDGLTFVDVSIGLLIKPVDAPSVLVGNVYSGTGSLVWDQVFSAHVWGETLCQQDTFLELKYFRLFFDSARCENARPISFARNTYIRGSRANIVTLSDVLWEVVNEEVSEEGAAEKLSLVEPLAE